MTQIEELKDAIQKLHGGYSRHRESVSIKEFFKGKTIWDGTVEVFDLHNHPKTHRAYAWSHETYNDGKRHVTVLHIPPVFHPEQR
jgi:hypothetical protein